MTEPAQSDQVNAAIEALNLPPPGQGNTGPTPTHHPDPTAASVAGSEGDDNAPLAV